MQTDTVTESQLDVVEPATPDWYIKRPLNGESPQILKLRLPHPVPQGPIAHDEKWFTTEWETALHKEKMVDTRMLRDMRVQVFKVTQNIIRRCKYVAGGWVVT
eukprot:gene15538-4672_t